MDWDDRPLPEDEAIKAAHPLRTNRHDLYQEAQRLVGAKHSKFALVELVNWLLHQVENAKQLPNVDPADEAVVDRLVARKTIKVVSRTMAPPIQFDDPVGVARDAVIEAAKAWGGYGNHPLCLNDDADMELATRLDALIAAEAKENE